MTWLSRVYADLDMRRQDRVAETVTAPAPGHRELSAADIAAARAALAGRFPPGPEPVPEPSGTSAADLRYQVAVRPLSGAREHLAHTDLMTLEQARREAGAYPPGRAWVVELREVGREPGV